MDTKTTYCDKCPLFTVCQVWRGHFLCIGCFMAEMRRLAA